VLSTTKPADTAAITQQIAELAMTCRTPGELLCGFEVYARSITARAARADGCRHLASYAQHYGEIT